MLKCYEVNLQHYIVIRYNHVVCTITSIINNVSYYTPVDYIKNNDCEF
jgi:hypothetical protein